MNLQETIKSLTNNTHRHHQSANKGVEIPVEYKIMP